MRLCRNKADGEESGVGGGPDVKLSLGKLGEGDYFGELAVLVQEALGRPFPRLRSALAVTSSCTLCTLTFGDLHALRDLSPRIDAAVLAAAAAIRGNRPSQRGAAAEVETKMAKLEAGQAQSETGQAKAEADMADVKAGQARLEGEIAGLKGLLEELVARRSTE